MGALPCQHTTHGEPSMPAGSFPEQTGCSPCPACRMVWDASPCIPAGPGRRSRIPLNISKTRSRAYTETCPALKQKAPLSPPLSPSSQSHPVSPFTLPFSYSHPFFHFELAQQRCLWMPWRVGGHTGRRREDTFSVWAAWQGTKGWSCFWCGESLAHSSSLLLPSL